MRVLIIKSSSLGDIVHALPAVRAFQAAQPEAAIDWLVERRWAPLLAGQALIDRLIAFDSHAIRAAPFSPAAYAGLIKDAARLRRRRYDAVVDLQRLTKSAALLCLVRADCRVGFAPSSCREPLAALVLGKKARINYQTDPISEQYLAPLSLLAGRPLSLPPPPHLSIDPTAQAAVNSWLMETTTGPYFVALLGGGFSTKIWPLSHWIDLLGRLATRQPVILVGRTPAERQQIKAAQEAVGGLTAAPALNLPQLAALLKGARLVVGPDTGPLHLAAAVGAPTVSFYGPTLARRNAPPGQPAIQSSAPCSGCVKRICPLGRPDCLAIVTPEMVWSKIEPIL